MAKKSKPKRPLTVREMQAKKQKKQNSDYVTIYNRCKQMIPIHLNAPEGIDFYFGAQDYRLGPGKTYKFPKSRLRMDQINRLCQQGMLQVLHDSEQYRTQKELEEEKRALEEQQILLEEQHVEAE